jgi:uncharacterized membrane protein/mono/diheme cytochrome c family protein
VLLSITEFIGRFHPVLVHLPIGILLVGLFLQFLAGRKKYQISNDVIKIVMLCGMATAIISCITGYMLSLNGDYEGNTVALHMWMGIAVAACSMLLCVKVINGQNDSTQRMASVALFVLILLTGHLGGSLTHGSNYLTAALFNQKPDTVAAKPIKNVQEVQAYSGLVQPLLQARCNSCHGPQKQKGGLRMDNLGFLFKGGKDGQVINPGNASHSELFKRLLLPKDDEHHMPPRQKPQLDEQQIALLRWWIDHGCDFIHKVKDIPQTDKDRSVLISFQADHQVHVSPPDVPDKPVAAANEKQIDSLRNRGVVVMPVAQDSHYLMADFVTVPATDKDLSMLLPLKQQLIWLKLGRTAITDNGLQVVGQLKQLRELNLNSTGITDAGLRSLYALDSLRLINLVGTKVTAKGISGLAGLKKLREVYLYQTDVDKKDWSDLQRKLPHVKLDSGGYRIPFLTTDTAVVKAPAKKK